MAHDEFREQGETPDYEDTGDWDGADGGGLSSEKPYVLLRPVAEPWKPDIDPKDVIEWPTFDAVESMHAHLVWADAAAIDLEWLGEAPFREGSQLVGVGVAWRAGDSIGARYLNWTTMTDELRAYALAALRSAGNIRLAHNVMGDGAWLDHEADRLGVGRIDFTYCTYALAKQLASEAFPGQSWSLKQLQLDLLRWPDTNELEVDEWLLANGHHKQGPKPRADETPAQHLAAIRAWIAAGTGAKPRRVAPDKSKLGLVPAPILGVYCLLDCLSTLQLYDDVLRPVLDRFPELDEFHRDTFIPMDRILWESTRDGICIDMDAMRAHAEFLRGCMARAVRQMRESPLGPHIRAWETELRSEIVSAEPPKFKKFDPGTEPVRFTKQGKESQSWVKWKAKVDRGPEVSKNWLSWRAKLDAAERGELDGYSFNADSDPQMRRVLYGNDGRGGPVKWRPTDRTGFKKGKQIPIFEIKGVNGWVDLQATESGELPTSGDLHTQLPAPLGTPLQLYADASQELSYCEAYLGAAVLHTDGHWRVHPSWISPRTKTLRLGGKDPNFQQVPKTIQFLRCFYPEPGQVWPEGDWSALEPHVLAELSRDPALLNLYGPGARKHDVYLYSGAGYAVLGDEIRKHYDVDNPDVAAAKKALKPQREACKVVVLAKSYGAGAAKIHAGLRLKGFELTFEQAKQISDSHDRMYSASGRTFQRQLDEEWEARGGWVMSAHGFPSPVWEGARKDLINRVIQRSGHDCHTIYVVRLDRALRAAGIRFKWVIPDFHDQFIASCAVADGPRFLEIVREQVTALNAELGTYVTLKLEPKLATDMAIAKESEFGWPEHVEKLTKGWVA